MCPFILCINGDKASLAWAKTGGGGTVGQLRGSDYMYKKLRKSISVF